eukprot:3096036-Rhodomonas_salina.1
MMRRLAKGGRWCNAGVNLNGGPVTHCDRDRDAARVSQGYDHRSADHCPRSLLEHSGTRVHWRTLAACQCKTVFSQGILAGSESRSASLSRSTLSGGTGIRTCGFESYLRLAASSLKAASTTVEGFSNALQ